MQTRRTFLKRSASWSLVGAGMVSAAAPIVRSLAALHAADTASLPIVDTHQHLWDLDKFQLPWLADAPAVLKRTYNSEDYRAATQGLNVVKAVYMEVDVAEAQQRLEADEITRLCESARTPTVAAVISGRPASERFAEYIRPFRDHPYVKGIRQVLHVPETPSGYCVTRSFIKSIQLLGELGLSFDLCMRPSDLGDAIRLVDECPDTRFILDHCGNADPNLFTGKPRAGGEKPAHDPAQWKRDIEQLAKRPRVHCKISGIVAQAPPDSDLANLLAPPINHCLDVFGPDRVLFGGDWPVCLLGASYADWVKALKAIIAPRDVSQQRRLLHDNAVRFYGLK